MRAYKARACACRACFGWKFTLFRRFRAVLDSLRAVLGRKYAKKRTFWAISGSFGQFEGGFGQKTRKKTHFLGSLGMKSVFFAV